jgi:hypothetical protein
MQSYFPFAGTPAFEPYAYSMPEPWVAGEVEIAGESFVGFDWPKVGPVTIAPHLISPIGMAYAWGQATGPEGFGLWGTDSSDGGGQAADGGPPPVDSGRAAPPPDRRGSPTTTFPPRDRGYDDRPRGRGRSRDHDQKGETDWTTIAWVAGGAVVLLGAVLVATSMGKGD